MRKNKLVKVEREELESITCNKCGKKVYIADDDYIDFNLMHNFKTCFGYGSKLECKSWNFDLCEECLFDIVKNFKFKPKQEKYDYL